MAALALRNRILVVLAGYLIVLLFAAVFVALGYLPPGALGPKTEPLSTSERLILGAIAVAPLAAGLLWDRLVNIKFGGVEIALAELAAAIDVELSTGVQEMKGSENIELTMAVSAAIAKTDLRLVEVNLRKHPYWWSTRLFLLAALAQEYTHIARLLIVADDADRRFIGLASPSGMRLALGSRFPQLETAFVEILNDVRKPGANISGQVQEFGFRWPHHSFGGDALRARESEFRELASPEVLRQWLGPALETYSRPWRRPPLGKRLYASMLNAPQPYIPLLQRGRLVAVVDRHDLAERLAAQAVS